ncbi:MAG: hypothetical protein WD336_00065, partial [Trueperaceae bacterium]
LGSDANRIGYGHADAAANLHGVAELLDVLAQPVAFVAATAAREAAQSASDPWADDVGRFEEDESWWLPDPVDLATASGTPVDLADREPRTLEVPGGVSADLDAGSGEIGGKISDLYRLPAVPAGTTVRVTMTSGPIDTYLRLVVPDAGGVLQDNDDAPDTSTSILRYVSDGVSEPYVIATSWSGSNTGPYQLEIGYEGDEEAEDAPDVEELVDPDEAMDDPLDDLPTFAQFLALFDLGPDALSIVADRLGDQRTVTVVDGADVRSEQTLEIRW